MVYCHSHERSFGRSDCRSSSPWLDSILWRPKNNNIGQRFSIHGSRLFTRTFFKEELECSPSDLVYGHSLRLPQEFSSATLANNLMNRSQLVAKLRDFVENLQPLSPRKHHGKFFIDKNLNDSKRIFIRNDHLQQPLSPRFSGPYDVVSRREKYFIISLYGINKFISIDRLKACCEDFPPPVESNASLVQETYRTRKGRVIRKPFRFRNNSL